MLAGAALAFALLAHPTPAVAIAALLAPLPLLALAIPRLVGMGDVKFAIPVGALLASQAGLGMVPWWWAWSLLGAAVALTVAGLVTRVRSARVDAPPLSPALLVAAAVGLLTG